MTEHWQRIKEVFFEAAQQPTEQRQAFLDEVCGQDDAVRDEVEHLLKHSDLASADRFLERLIEVKPADETTVPPDTHLVQHVSSSESPPEHIGRYEIVRLLGAGGMGTVYLGRDDQLDRHIAIKVPSLNQKSQSTQLERFLREARSAASLRHPNICPIYEVAEADGIPYIAMAYIEGRPLSKFIRPDKPLPVRAVLLVVRKLTKALAVAHEKGVIHRDLKPANIMIDDRQEPIIMDFGLARRVRTDEESLTKPGQVVGTPSYMSPEQLTGDPEAVGAASDIYSLGVILYQLLTGELPFKSDDLLRVLSQIALDDPQQPSGIRSDIDYEVEEICLKALSKDPNARFASMNEFTAVLTEYLKLHRPQTESVQDEAHVFARSTVEELDTINEPNESTYGETPIPPPVQKSMVKIQQTRKRTWLYGPLLGVLSVIALLILVILIPRSTQDKPQSDGNQFPKITPVHFDGHSYALVQDHLSWGEAQHRCELLGGHLLTIGLRGEWEFVKSMLEGKNESAYIGASDEDRDGRWQWITGEDVRGNMWLNGEPNPTNDGYHAGILNGEKGVAMVNLNGANRLSFICEWEAEVNEVPTLTLSEFGGHSYCVIWSAKNWHDAKQSCDLLGGHLLTVDNDEEWAFAKTLVKTPLKHLYVGATDESHEGDWRWLDGRPLSNASSLWWPHEPNNINNGEHYGAISRDTSDSTEGIEIKLFDAVGWDEIPFICEWDCPRKKAAPVSSCMAHMLTNGIGMKLIRIPAGEFMMGSPAQLPHLSNVPAAEQPQHRVKIARPLYFGVYEVTQQQFERVMQRNPSHFSKDGQGKSDVLAFSTDRFPVESISWEDATEFCRILSSLPEEQASNRYYRLPTEAEWEYACRGGTTHQVTQSTIQNALRRMANGRDESLKRRDSQMRDVLPWNDIHPYTAPVGRYAPNAFGLYDMLGNVWEWCADVFDATYYEVSPDTDPRGPTDGNTRVLRGGSFSHSWGCRPGIRFHSTPSFRNSDLGFRVVCEVRRPRGASNRRRPRTREDSPSQSFNRNDAERAANE